MTTTSLKQAAETVVNWQRQAKKINLRVKLGSFCTEAN